MKSPLGDWTPHHSTSGIWISYESQDKVYELILSPTVLQRDVPTNRLPVETDDTVPNRNDKIDRTRHPETIENNNDNSENNNGTSIENNIDQNANNIDNTENNKTTDENEDNVFKCYRCNRKYYRREFPRD